MEIKHLRTLQLVTTEYGDAVGPSLHQHEERTSYMQINSLFQ